MNTARTLACFLKYAEQAASTRQRIQQYYPALAEAGILPAEYVLFGNSHLENIRNRHRPSAVPTIASYLRRVRKILHGIKADAIFLHCEVFPYLPSFFETLIFRTGIPLVLDFDDAIFHQYDAHRSALVRGLLGTKLQALMRRATVCTAGNVYLAAYARRFCDNVQVVPTVVDTDLWQPAEKLDAEGPPVIGWIGSPSTWAYVEPLLPMLATLHERHGVRFRIVGAGRRALPTFVDQIEWTLANEIADVQAMDIGIMPLADDVWAQGKCGYKLIQYQACGLPVVASPVGVNRDIVQDGTNGFLAATTEQFGRTLETLIGDIAMRRRFGAAGRRHTLARYSLAVTAPKVVSIVEGLMQRSSAG